MTRGDAIERQDVNFGRGPLQGGQGGFATIPVVCVCVCSHGLGLYFNVRMCVCVRRSSETALKVWVGVMSSLPSQSSNYTWGSMRRACVVPLRLQATTIPRSSSDQEPIGLERSPTHKDRTRMNACARTSEKTRPDKELERTRALLTKESRKCHAHTTSTTKHITCTGRSTCRHVRQNYHRHTSMRVSACCPRYIRLVLAPGHLPNADRALHLRPLCELALPSLADRDELARGLPHRPARCCGAGEWRVERREKSA